MTKERLKKLQAEIQKYDADGFLICDKTNRRYFSGFSGSAGYLLFTGTETILFVDGRYVEQAKRQTKGWNIIHFKDPYVELAEKLSQCNVRKLCIDPEKVSYSNVLLLENKVKDLGFEIEFVSKGISLASLRAVKDKEEITLLKKAVAIGDDAFMRTKNRIVSNTTEREIAWYFEQQARTLGAESLSFSTIVARGPNSALAHYPTGDDKILSNDVLLIDCGVQYFGYCSDLTRTILLGDISTEIREIYKIVEEAQQTAIQQVKVGMTGADVDKIARDVITKYNYGDNFTHSLGHGVGLDIHEKPNLSLKSEDVLMENMVFTVEPGIYIEGLGGVRIEDVVLLTNHGTKLLSKAAY